MTNIQVMLSKDEAYDAMVDYLDRYYFKVLAKDPTSSGNLGSLLGCMMLAADETPMDSALAEDWSDSIDKILNKRPQKLAPEEYGSTKLTPEEAYAAMADYLNEYGNRIESEEIRTLLNFMTNKTIPNPTVWNDWMVSVNKMSAPKTRVRQYFELLPRE